MDWGIRIGIISVAFVVGLTLIGPAVTSAGSKTSDIPRVNERIGGSLIVACDSGDIAIRRVEKEPGAVQFECVQGKVVVVEDRHEMKSPLPAAEGRARPAKL
jgi:hypothetical protein